MIAKSHEVVIWETKDYDNFKFDKRNSSIGNTKKLEESIKEHNFCFYEPILVNYDMVIIEGQHIFTACKNLGLPIYFRICDEDIYSMIQTLNRGRRKWNYSNFAKSRNTKSHMPIALRLLDLLKESSIFIQIDKWINWLKKY